MSNAAPDVVTPSEPEIIGVGVGTRAPGSKMVVAGSFSGADIVRLASNLNSIARYNIVINER